MNILPRTLRSADLIRDFDPQVAVTGDCVAVASDDASVDR
jgi:hypothetical protein